MIFFHIGWMKQYRGPNEDDPTIGSHSHLKNNKFGHECFNFFSRDGNCFGYVPTKGINLSNLGASRHVDFVDDVVCVWIAKDPERQTRVIVGWYSASRVFGSSNHRIQQSGNKLDHQEIGYHAVAPEAGCSLIPVSRRIFKIPTRYDMKGGLGQSNVWYGGNAKFHRKVWEYIKNCDDRKTGKMRQPTSLGSPRGRRNLDSDQRKKVESIAVEIATEYFRSHEGGAYQVVSKEKDNLGWDIEASRPDRVTLLIEVKGLSGENVSVELTPNEYKQMTSKRYRDNYVLFVVTNCLGKQPMTYEYRFKDGRWEDTDGGVLQLKELIRIGAVCSTTR